MAAKSLGELYVKLSARTAGFAESLGKAADEGAKRLADAADEIEGKSAKMAAALGDIADGFLAVGGVAALAFAGAADYSEPVKQALDDLKGTTATLAKELAEALLPVLKDTTAFIRGMVSAWRSLDDGTKANIVSAVRWAAVIGPGLAALGKGIVIAKGFLEAFVVIGPILGSVSKSLLTVSTSAIAVEAAVAGAGAAGTAAAPGLLASAGAAASGFAAALIPVAAFVAAVAAVVLLAGAVHKAWNDTSTGLREAVLSSVDDVQRLASNVFQFYMDMWKGLAGFVADAAGMVLDVATAQFRRLAALAAPITKALGMDTATAALETVQGMTGAQLGKDVRAGADYLADKAAAAGGIFKSALMAGADGVTFGLKYAASGAKDMLSGAFDELKSMLPDFSGAGVGKAKSLADSDKEYAAFNEQLAKENAYAQQQDAREAGMALGAEDRAGAENFASEADSDAFERALAELQAQELADSAEEYRKASIAEYKSAADSFADLAQESRDFAAAAREKAREAADAFVSKILGRTGIIGDLINSFQQGMQMSGGNVWGGVAAVAVDLASRSEAFEEIIDMVTEIFGVVIEAFGGVFEGLQPVIGAIGIVVETLMTALQPILDQLSKALSSFAPALIVIGTLIEGLAPILDVLGMAFKPLEWVAKGLFYVLKYIAIVILGIVEGLASAWNTLVGWLSDSIKIDTTGIKEARRKLENTTFPSAMEQAAGAAEKFKNNVDKATESLTNVPQLFKLALRRGQAANAIGSAVGGGSTVNNTSVVINSTDPDEVAERLERILDYRERKEGNMNSGELGIRPSGRFAPAVLT